MEEKKNGSNGSIVVNRYSDEDLNEFKKLILEHRDKAEKLFLFHKGLIDNLGGNDIGDTSPVFKVLGEGDVTLSKEENSKLALRQLHYIDKLDKALERIKFKVYGVCMQTGNLISKQRLLAVPVTTLSIDVKKEQAQKMDCYSR